MGRDSLQRQLEQARHTIRELRDELDQTHRGLMALALELERRVDERTAELRATQEELQKSNSELMVFSLDLENRVAERTAELQAKHAEVDEMSQQLWQAVKLATMGELSASIAHELNNPLTTVSLRVESLLAQTSADDPQHKALTIIEREVERMGALVANLLQFSRRSPQQATTVDVSEEIEHAEELISYHLRNRSIVIRREFAPDVPPIIADRQHLRQVFLNLFSNAADAMTGGGTLTVRVQAPGAPPASVVVQVSDTGTGIPPDLLPKVLEPFFTTKPPGKGTGLGLPICRRLIEEHHGTLAITSQMGQGTTVQITLPITRDGEGAPAREPALEE